MYYIKYVLIRIIMITIYFAHIHHMKISTPIYYDKPNYNKSSSYSL